MKARKIITYSSLERRKNRIMGAETYLGFFLFMFPVIPILLALFSCFIYKLSDNLYSTLFMTGTIILAVCFLLAEIHWLKELMTVYMIGDDGELYRLHISMFWYKIKQCTNLVNPMETTGGKWMQLFYMISNIKIALEAAGDVTFEELIQMGRLTRISGITNVSGYKKKICLCADIETKKGIRQGKIKIRKVYDNIDALKEYLVIYQSDGVKAAEKYDFKVKVNPLSYVKENKTLVQKSIRFILIWTGILLWISLFTVYSDLNKLSNINSGRYQKVVAYAEEKESGHTEASFVLNGEEHLINVSSGYLETDGEKYSVVVYVEAENPQNYFYKQAYGQMYKPVFVLYIMVVMIYLISNISQYIIDKVKAKKE